MQVANDGGAAPVAEVEALIARGRALPVLLDKECQVRPPPPRPLAAAIQSLFCALFDLADNRQSAVLVSNTSPQAGRLERCQQSRLRRRRKAGGTTLLLFGWEDIDVAVCTRLPPPIRVSARVSAGAPGAVPAVLHVPEALR